MKILPILLFEFTQARKSCLLNYFGEVSSTVSGRECQYWDENYPHEPKYTPKNKSHNKCRNPDKDPKGPWCYTTDPDVRFEYCQPDDCIDGTGQTCWSDDIEYEGTPLSKFIRYEKGNLESHTESGIECQAWARNKPHRPKHRPRRYKSQANYCRNPDGDPKGPWCYTSDPDVRFEYCKIPKCPELSDLHENYDSDYYEDDDWLVDDTSDNDYYQGYGGFLEYLAAFLGPVDLVSNNFDADYEAYDYNSTDFDDYREDLPENLGCQTLSLPEPGSDYVGTVSTTRSGLRCQNWQDQRPHRHNSHSVGNHNHCRNLDFDSTDAPKGIWCYTTDPDIRWEFCDQVPVCENTESSSERQN